MSSTQNTKMEDMDMEFTEVKLEKITQVAGRGKGKVAAKKTGSVCRPKPQARKQHERATPFSMAISSVLSSPTPAGRPVVIKKENAGWNLLLEQAQTAFRDGQATLNKLVAQQSAASSRPLKEQQAIAKDVADQSKIVRMLQERVDRLSTVPADVNSPMMRFDSGEEDYKDSEEEDDDLPLQPLNTARSSKSTESSATKRKRNTIILDPLSSPSSGDKFAPILQKRYGRHANYVEPPPPPPETAVSVKTPVTLPAGLRTRKDISTEEFQGHAKPVNENVRQYQPLEKPLERSSVRRINRTNGRGMVFQQQPLRIKPMSECVREPDPESP